MNWITTNIRFPEEQYMELKMEAARLRKSISAIVRERVGEVRTGEKRENTDAFMKKLNRFAKKMAKKYKGLNLTKALIDMRYEQ